MCVFVFCICSIAIGVYHGTKTKIVHVYCLIQNSLFSVLTSQFHGLYKNYNIIFFPYVICSNKNVKKKYGPSGVGRIRTRNLAVVGSGEGFEETLFNP